MIQQANRPKKAIAKSLLLVDCCCKTRKTGQHDETETLLADLGVQARAKQQGDVDRHHLVANHSMRDLKNLEKPHVYLTSESQEMAFAMTNWG